MQTTDRIEELFIDGRLLDEGVRFAAQQAVWEAKQLGFPISVWRDGRVVIIQPEDIQVEKPVANFPIPAKRAK